MSPRIRFGMFAAACACLLEPVGVLVWSMPAFGGHPIPYGDAIAASAPKLRHVANLVTAVNFDYRAIDTLGEEFILLCAVTGVSVLLRGVRGEQTSAKPGRVEGRPIMPSSEAVTLVCRMFGVLTLLFGLDVALHATTTPGGGFQGGVVIASGFLLVYLGEGYPGWRKLIRSEWLDGVEAGGAALFALCGLAGPVVGATFMTNVLPLGKFGSVWSGGLMVVINVGVTLAVAGGFGVLMLEFLEETRAEPERAE